MIKEVTEFHKAFGHIINESPTLLKEATAELRFNLMVEENREYIEGSYDEDIVEIADALGDMLYVLTGTIISHGLQNVMPLVFEEIHRSNMSKLGEDGKPIYREDGKILKGPNYFKPNLKQFFKK
jgi:predicted HAD superfamily Cof-like phosphohydrolase